MLLSILRALFYIFSEVEASVGKMLEKKLEEHNAIQHYTYIFSKIKEAFLSSVDYTSYGLTDVVHLDDFDAELCESFLLNRDLKTKVELLDLIEEFFEVCCDNRIPMERLEITIDSHAAT